MKFISIFLVLGSVSFSSAYEGFRCIPSMRDTRLQVLVEKEDVRVLVVNAMGYEFMPQFDGPQSVFNFSFNKMQGEDLRVLGDGFTFVWPKESCQIDSEHFTANCRSEARAAVNTVKSFGMTTTEVTEKYNGETYEKRKFRFTFEKENLYFVTLQYDSKACEKLN